MNIGTTIKKYRKKNDITQEQLAEYLNLSVSAISQWECGKTMPDIALLPIIAGIFEITTDELLGVDLSKKQQEIDRIIEEYDRLSNLGLEKERFDYIVSAYRKYPTAARIIDKYLWMLCYDPYHGYNGLLAHEEELTALCENILNESPEDFLRYTALSIMSGLYREKGDLPQAIAYAKRLPPFCECAGDQLENIYERGSEPWWEQVRENIYSIAGHLMVKIRNCALYAPLPAEERIRIFNKAIALIDLIYDEKDYGFSHYDLCELNIWIANRYIELNDFDHASEYLDRGLDHAKTYDELPAITEHTSFLVKGYQFETAKVYSGFPGNEMKRELDYIDQNNFYDAVREMPWFLAILAKYRPYASDTKPQR